MSNKVHQTLLIAITILGTAACGEDEGPCVLGPDEECIAGETGETGKPEIPECAPFEKAEVGTSMVCQGEGTGWLVTDVYGAGKHNPLTSCLAYNAENVEDIPEYPTSADCRSIPLDMIPYDITTPTACCTEDADDQNFIDTCELDCGYAAAKTAVAAMRDYADKLVAPSALLEDAYDTSKADIYALADLLETPAGMSHVANKVSASPGEVVAVGLNSGPSDPLAFGHIKQATLYVGCTLDPDEPYTPALSNDECTEPTNIPLELGEQESGGIIHAGAITVAGVGVNVVAPLSNIKVSMRETLTRDMGIAFTLTAFDASIPDAAAGSFQFRDAKISLAAPASGTLEGDTVTFAPGALRFSVTAAVLVNGVKMFGGIPLTAEYGNASSATAIRRIDGSFHFVDATFTAGEYTAVLNTQPSILAPIQ
jgi:hypothetical protein